jgi:hypothetical protein
MFTCTGPAGPTAGADHENSLFGGLEGCGLFAFFAYALLRLGGIIKPLGQSEISISN